MIVEFDKSFAKSLDKIHNQKILKRIENTILVLEQAASLKEIPNIKKLTGYQYYYRLRIGSYRMGIEQVNQESIRLIIVADRKDIYRRFP